MEEKLTIHAAALILSTARERGEEAAFKQFEREIGPNFSWNPTTRPRIINWDPTFNSALVTAQEARLQPKSNTATVLNALDRAIPPDSKVRAYDFQEFERKRRIKSFAAETPGKILKRVSSVSIPMGSMKINSGPFYYYYCDRMQLGLIPRFSETSPAFELKGGMTSFGSFLATAFFLAVVRGIGWDQDEKLDPMSAAEILFCLIDFSSAANLPGQPTKQLKFGQPELMMVSANEFLSGLELLEKFYLMHCKKLGISPPPAKRPERGPLSAFNAPIDDLFK